MGTWPATNLLIRLDPRARGAQQQIYAGIRRAILDGVVAPERASPPRARWPRISACPARPPCWRWSSSGGGTSPRAGARAPSSRRTSRTTSRKGARYGRRAAPGIRRCRAEARPGGDADGRPAARRVRPAVSHRDAGVDLFPVRLWARLATRRLRTITAAQLDYGESGGIRVLREAIAAHVRIARGAECDADQVVIVAGAQQGRPRLPALARPGDRAWMEDPGYPGARSALVGRGGSSRCASTPRAWTSRRACGAPATRGWST